MVQACSRHSCQKCGFKFWYAVDEEDDGGEEVLEDENAEKRRVLEARVEAARISKPRRWIRLSLLEWAAGELGRGEGIRREARTGRPTAEVILDVREHILPGLRGRLG